MLKKPAKFKPLRGLKNPASDEGLSLIIRPSASPRGEKVVRAALESHTESQVHRNRPSKSFG